MLDDVARTEISDEAWAVIGPLFPLPKSTGRPPVERHTVVQSLAQQSGDLDWVASIDSTIVRVHQHGATLPRTTGALSNYKKFGEEPPDHAIGRPRGGLTTKNHLVCDGKGRALAFRQDRPQLSRRPLPRRHSPLGQHHTLERRRSDAAMPLVKQPHCCPISSGMS